jgi:hypothetical protein
VDESSPSRVVRVVGDPSGLRGGAAFRSHSEEGTSTTTAGMPFVSCYHGINDGVIFPLSQGLLFVKPPLFVPVDSIRSIAIGSRSSSGGRYVDLNVVTSTHGSDSDGAMEEHATIEFTNIHRDEASGLNGYIQSLVEARGGEAARDPAAGEDRVGTGASSPARQSRRSGGPPPRKASVAARAACLRDPTAAGNDSENDDDDDEGEDANYVALAKDSAMSGSDDSDDNSDEADDDDRDHADGSESEEVEVGVDENSDEEEDDDDATESEPEDDDDNYDHAASNKKLRQA